MDWKAALSIGGVFAIASFVCLSVLMRLLELPILSSLDSGQVFTLSMTLIAASTLFFVVGAITFIQNGKKKIASAPVVRQGIDGNGNEQAAPTPSRSNAVTIEQKIKGSNNKQSIGPKNV